MSKQPNLLDVPENPSPRLRRIAELSGTLEVAKKVHGILTHWADIGELPWLDAHPPQDWDTNPWVWVYEFGRVK